MCVCLCVYCLCDAGELPIASCMKSKHWGTPTDPWAFVCQSVLGTVPCLATFTANSLDSSSNPPFIVLTKVSSRFWQMSPQEDRRQALPWLRIHALEMVLLCVLFIIHNSVYGAAVFLTNQTINRGCSRKRSQSWRAEIFITFDICVVQSCFHWTPITSEIYEINKYEF